MSRPRSWRPTRRPRRKVISHLAAILTVSDKAAAGRREDLAGPRLAKALAAAGVEVAHTDTVPDEVELIAARLIHYADELGLSLVITTGGTGLSPRDITPEATLSVIDRQAPGLAEAMRAEGLKHTPMAMLSRAVCGMRGSTLIINLPGSPKGAMEGIGAILPALGHGLDKLAGDPSDCAR